MVDDGYVVTNMTGIKAYITTRLDGTGYDITRCELTVRISLMDHIDRRMS